MGFLGFSLLIILICQSILSSSQLLLPVYPAVCVVCCHLQLSVFFLVTTSLHSSSSISLLPVSQLFLVPISLLSYLTSILSCVFCSSSFPVSICPASFSLALFYFLLLRIVHFSFAPSCSIWLCFIFFALVLIPFSKREKKNTKKRVMDILIAVVSKIAEYTIGPFQPFWGYDNNFEDLEKKEDELRKKSEELGTTGDEIVTLSTWQGEVKTSRKRSRRLEVSGKTS